MSRARVLLERPYFCIARVFRELNLIEQWGSGIPRMFREAEELGLPELQIAKIGMRMRVIVPLLEGIAVPKRTSAPTDHLADVVRCLDVPVRPAFRL